MFHASGSAMPTVYPLQLCRWTGSGGGVRVVFECRDGLFLWALCRPPRRGWTAAEATSTVIHPAKGMPRRRASRRWQSRPQERARLRRAMKAPRRPMRWRRRASQRKAQEEPRRRASRPRRATKTPQGRRRRRARPRDCLATQGSFWTRMVHSPRSTKTSRCLRSIWRNIGLSMTSAQMAVRFSPKCTRVGSSKGFSTSTFLRHGCAGLRLTRLGSERKSVQGAQPLSEGRNYRYRRSRVSSSQSGRCRLRTCCASCVRSSFSAQRVVCLASSRRIFSRMRPSSSQKAGARCVWMR
mmetsp:Transcript_3314/g.9512  ORF Transcript_3314/g.9512 Transcript_3314/m.9512 type:complete len:296 (-) Transcript_3314:835-1722(-)